jgi:hypothetical protein
VRADFASDADNYDVDAVQRLHNHPFVCSVPNEATGSYTVLINDQNTDLYLKAKTSVTIDESACQEETGSIAGQVWNDLNNNAVKNVGETGLSGWTVYLDANDNGTLDGSEVSTTADLNGNYVFSNLTTGSYIVREVVGSGFTQTFPTLINQQKHVVFVTNSNITDQDFGNFRSGDEGGGGNNGGGENPKGSITGVVFSDTNSDGVKDPGDSALSGWTVFIDANDNGTLDGGEVSLVTTSNYSFTNLSDGTYVIREVLQSGWTQTGPVGNKYTVIIASANNVTDKDFGNHQTEGNSGGGGSNGGGGSSSGGGGGAVLIPTLTPTPQVLGATAPVAGLPMPEVGGAATELPRTGAGALALIIPSLFALAGVLGKKKI